MEEEDAFYDVAEEEREEHEKREERKERKRQEEQVSVAHAIALGPMEQLFNLLVQEELDVDDVMDMLMDFQTARQVRPPQPRQTPRKVAARNMSSNREGKQQMAKRKLLEQRKQK